MEATIDRGTGRLTPSERLEALCDPDSLRAIRSAVQPATQLGGDMPGDGVVAAAGRVNGRPVLCYAQDRSCAGGSLGAAGAWTIVRVLELAEQARCPVVGFIESAGARMQEGVAALGGYGRVFSRIVALGHEVPQISVVCGPSAGGGAYASALTDFLIMTRSATMFLTGPTVVRAATGEDVSMAELGGPAVHERNGLCDLVAEDDREAADLARELLGYLPQNAGGAPKLVPPGAAPDAHAVGDLVPRDRRRVYDMGAVVERLVDDAHVRELSPKWARNMFTAFCRLEGQPVGFIATQPRYIGGVIDAAASKKGARFVDVCNAYGIPIVALVDTPGFMPGTRQESAAVIRHGAELIRAFSRAEVYRLTVVLRKAYGGAYITINSKELGAHFTFAWPDAEIGVMAPRSAAFVMDKRSLDASPNGHRGGRSSEADDEEQVSAVTAARRGFLDEVISPAATRSRLCWALGILADTQPPQAGS